MACFEYCSYGIHPWYIENEQEQFAVLSEVAGLPGTVAIGEAGLDKSAGPEMTKQTEVFRKQAVIAEKEGKPLIIHCVKAWEELLKIKKEVSPRVPWIIHGFRGNAQLAGQLIKQGFCLSFGEKFNPEALRTAWPYNVLTETDDSFISIQNVYKQLAGSLPVSLDAFASNIAENSKRIFVCFK